MSREHEPPTLTETDLLKVEVIAPDGEFSAWVRWNDSAVAWFRERVGDEVATNLLRGLGRDFVESVEDVLARRDHPAGRCLPRCPRHGDASAAEHRA